MPKDYAQGLCPRTMPKDYAQGLCLSFSVLFRCSVAPGLCLSFSEDYVAPLLQDYACPFPSAFPRTMPVLFRCLFRCSFPLLQQRPAVVGLRAAHAGVVTPRAGMGGVLGSLRGGHEKLPVVDLGRRDRGEAGKDKAGDGREGGGHRPGAK
jgi:hypothetical protein